MKSSGFDVIIGNPPYVETKKIDYTVRGFRTAPCGDLYAFCMERSANLLTSMGRLSMIVPISIISTDGFSTLRNFFQKPYAITWTLNFAERPSKLFSGVEKRLTIWLSKLDKNQFSEFYLSNYKRWMAEERDSLFSTNHFVSHINECSIVGDSIPKIWEPTEISIMKKLSIEKPISTYFLNASKQIVSYTRKLRYFVQFFDFIPLIINDKSKKIEPSELKELHLKDAAQKEITISILNSSLFFWFFCAFSDVRNVNKREISAFRCSIEQMKPAIVSKLRKLCKNLMESFESNSRMLTSDYKKNGVLSIQSFQPRLSKSIIDEIDRVLAKHYGFTDEELDFIINYDIKYRMGRDAGSEEE
jgi:hypothetical protein